MADGFQITTLRNWCSSNCPARPGLPTKISPCSCPSNYESPTLNRSAWVVLPLSGTGLTAVLSLIPAILRQILYFLKSILMIGYESTGKGTLTPLIKSQFHGGLEWPQRLPLCPHPGPCALIRAGSQEAGVAGHSPPRHCSLGGGGMCNPTLSPEKLKSIIWHLL